MYVYISLALSLSLYIYIYIYIHIMLRTHLGPKVMSAQPSAGVVISPRRLAAIRQYDNLMTQHDIMQYNITL